MGLENTNTEIPASGDTTACQNETTKDTFWSGGLQPTGRRTQGCGERVIRGSGALQFERHHGSFGNTEISASTGGNPGTGGYTERNPRTSRELLA